MNSEGITDAYRRYAKFYDLTFGSILARGRRELIRVMRPRSGQRVLEIGVGTGLSLPLYPTGVQVTGIDLSPEMLKKAQQRVSRLGIPNVVLKIMDAQQMEFPDGYFDVCVAMYVASVASDPAALVREMRRVTRPGGKIYILNHFSRKGSVMSFFERLLHPFADWIGFEPSFYQDEFLSRTGLGKVNDFPVPPFGYWRILDFENHPGPRGKVNVSVSPDISGLVTGPIEPVVDGSA